MRRFADAVLGCVVGAAVGDGLGGATEGWQPEAIAAAYPGGVEGVVASRPGARPLSRFHKGDGVVTDDTMMTRALIEVYAERRRHLSAYDVADGLVPRMVGERRWIPDMGREDELRQRVADAERWLVGQLLVAHDDPREAGKGNIVNCGAAMYIAPVGVVNAGDAAGAYAEAIDMAGAHQGSYGREAAGVLAAAVAAAMAGDAAPSVDGVVGAALDVAHDGTRAAIETVCERARRFDAWRPALPALREAVAPFDTVGPVYREPSLGARRPSRLHAIEELPIALGMLVVAGGRYRDAVLGAVNYGRDADSIASMAGALAGAMAGLSAIPEDWRAAVATASHLDLEAPARALTDAARAILTADAHRHATRAHQCEELLQPEDV